MEFGLLVLLMKKEEKLPIKKMKKEEKSLSYSLASISGAMIHGVYCLGHYDLEKGSEVGTENIHKA